MSLPKALTTVTPLSKTIAILLFTFLPLFSFFFGMKYQRSLIPPSTNNIAPKKPEEVACTMDAKVCPDGTAVGRIPPNCEFAPCPQTYNGSTIDTIEECMARGYQTTTTVPRQCTTPDGTTFIETTVGTIGADDPKSRATLAGYPDLPLSQVPPFPVDVKFAVEHRSALNNEQISVKGVVIGKWINEECRGENCVGVGMYLPPYLFIADTSDEQRNKLYDLTIVFPEDKIEILDSFQIGQMVTTTGIVSGHIGGIAVSYITSY